MGCAGDEVAVLVLDGQRRRRSVPPSLTRCGTGSLVRPLRQQKVLAVAMTTECSMTSATTRYLRSRNQIFFLSPSAAAQVQLRWQGMSHWSAYCAGATREAVVSSRTRSATMPPRPTPVLRRRGAANGAGRARERRREVSRRSATSWMRRRRTHWCEGSGQERVAVSDRTVGDEGVART